MDLPSLSLGSVWFGTDGAFGTALPDTVFTLQPTLLFLPLALCPFPWGTLTCWGFADKGDCRLELIFSYSYFYFILLEIQVESITPILNSVWLRHMVLERTSQNGEFAVMHSQVSSLSMEYKWLLSYFEAFSFSFASLVPIMWFSARCTFLFFPSCLSYSLISAKIFNPFFQLLLFVCKSNHRSASNSCMSYSNCFYL